MNTNGIETDTFVNIINKLNMYIEIENNNIMEIKTAISNLENNYNGFNNTKVKNKTMEITNNIDTMIRNKRKYVRHLEQVLKNYIDLDASTSIKFSEDDIN